jgi:hypothetical protein
MGDESAMHRLFEGYLLALNAAADKRGLRDAITDFAAGFDLCNCTESELSDRSTVNLPGDVTRNFVAHCILLSNKTILWA